MAATPSSALGSTRDKPDEAYCREIFRVLKAHSITQFHYIGGNDSSDTVHIVSEQARSSGYALRCIHIPKTIDNDLLLNDHTPGFPSAARFVVQAFAGANLDNASLPGVYVAVVMGRHAGFLTAASALARKYPGDGPHLVYLPERDFDVERFLADVKAVYEAASGSVTVRRVGDYAVDYQLASLGEIAGRTRLMDDAFIAPSGNDVTEAFRAYLRPLLGTGLPDAGRLRAPSVIRASVSEASVPKASG